MHALIHNGQVIETRTLPALWQDDEGRWWDFRDGQRNPAEVGWQPVTRTPRPTDDTHAYDWSVELVDG